MMCFSLFCAQPPEVYNVWYVDSFCSVSDIIDSALPELL